MSGTYSFLVKYYRVRDKTLPLTFFCFSLFFLIYFPHHYDNRAGRGRDEVMHSGK